MKKHLCFAFITLFLVVLSPMPIIKASELSEAFILYDEAKNLPTIAVFDEKGEPQKFLPGRAMLLNFWASWCGPCIVEMPALDELARVLDKEGIDVRIVSQDSRQDSALQAFKRLNISNMPFLIDHQGALAQKLDVRSLPTTFLITPEGQLRARLNSPDEWDSAKTLEAINILLTQKTKNTSIR